ncbi:MAG TPA: methyltransferase domain-containing protein [Steroidobacteraceae bacterium]|nr:methyltransferase domain-containing protein [Steroidobacteraceae bacterium]
MSLRSALEAQRADPRGFGGWLVARLMLHRPVDRARTRWVLSLLELRPEDRVLDVGFGPAYSTQLIADQVTSGLVVGVDRSPLMLDMARRRLRRHLHSRRVTLMCTDAADLPPFDVRFDKALSINLPGMAEDSVGLLTRVRERMAAGGRIAVALSAPASGPAGGAAQTLGSTLGEKLAQAGFVRSTAHYSGATGSTPSVCVLAEA